MTRNNNTNVDDQNLFGVHHNCYLNNLSFEEDPIEQFLNDEAFLDRHSSSNQN
jgi:hypothetical protein